MPHLRCRAMSQPDVERLSLTLIGELAALLGADPAHFTLERLESTFVADGWPVHGSPMIEVHWFARSQEQQDAAARLITARVREIVGEGDKIAVLFFALERHAYYSDGAHF
ncbi:DUF1904 family protein [Aeromonas diversa]|uniref:DUF1904 family protein n=1 Tax=Aeromonas diversa TaxID=502790 RepID=UPI0039A35C57